MGEILLIEDQTDLGRLLGLFLRETGYAVTCAATGEEGVLLSRAEEYKLVILDINLPGIDGFAVCQQLRKRGNLPILILSARVGKEDKLNGFLLGADDYMEKPVDPEVLVAKVRAIFARVYASPEGGEGQICSGEIRIDTKARRVYKNDVPIELNVKEYDLFLLLVQNEGKVLQKEFLFDQIWGTDSFSENQTLTVHIKRLRDKIEDDSKHPGRIKTIWGVGYVYEKI